MGSAVFVFFSFSTVVSYFLTNPDEPSDPGFPVFVSAGGNGHQPHGVFPAQQPGQLFQPAPGQQGARGGREQRGGGVAQEARQGMKASPVKPSI